jgi:Phage tail tube protein
MSSARGDEAKLFSRIQAAFGTAEVAGAGKFYHLPFYSLNTTPSSELNEDDAIYGDAFPGDAVEGVRNLSGSMVVPLGLSSIGWHLRALLGAPVTTEVVAATDYQHVFTAAAQPDLGLMTNGITHSRKSVHFVQDSLAYSGLEINARKNSERARATFNLIGREEVPGASALDSAPVQFSPDPNPVGFAAKALIDNVEAAAVVGANLSLTKGIEADQETLNGLATASGIEHGNWGLSGSLDARFRDRDLYDKADSGDSFALKLAWAFSAKFSLEILAHDVRLERTGIPVDGRGVISSTYNWRTNRPAPGSTIFTAILKNQVADYNNPA